jgi:hypothetical protein
MLPPAHPKEIRERAFAMFADGKPYSDISFELRIPASTVRAWACRDVWPQRLAVRQNQPQLLDTDTEISLAREAAEPDEIPLDLPSQQEKYQSNMAFAAVRLSETVRLMPTHDILSKADKLNKVDQVGRRALRIENAPPACIINVALLSGTTGKQPRLVSDSSSGRALTDALPSQDWP